MFKINNESILFYIKVCFGNLIFDQVGAINIYFKNVIGKKW